MFDLPLIQQPLCPKFTFNETAPSPPDPTHPRFNRLDHLGNAQHWPLPKAILPLGRGRVNILASNSYPRFTEAAIGPIGNCP